MKRLAFALAVWSIGCVSRAGPYVTNIAYAPNGVLVVDKCYVEYNAGLRSVSNQDCTRSTVVPPTVGPPR